MKRLLYILPLLALLFGCEDPLANTAVQQDEKIESFITSKYTDMPRIINEGVNRVVLEEGDSTAFAQRGDLVDFEYIGYTFTSSIGSPFTQGAFKDILDDDHMIRGLAYGMVGMCPGEKAYIIFSCKYGYDKPVAGQGRDQALAFEVILNEINGE